MRNFIVNVIGLIILAGLAFGGYQLYKSQQELTERIAMIESSERMEIKDVTQFNSLVKEAVEHLVDEKNKQLVKNKFAKQALASLDSGEQHIYGSADARITVIEFSDLECPYCKGFHNTLRTVVAKSKKNINWQWMNYPLKFHNPSALQQAIIGECVAEYKDNKTFWVYLDEIFAKSRGNGKGVVNLRELTINVTGMTNIEYESCLDNVEMAQRVQVQMEVAKQYGITSTPSSIIMDNKTKKVSVVSGALGVEALYSAIGKLMKE